MFVVFSSLYLQALSWCPRISGLCRKSEKSVLLLSPGAGCGNRPQLRCSPWIVMGSERISSIRRYHEHFGRIVLSLPERIERQELSPSIVLIAFATLGYMKLRSTKSLATSRSFCAGSCFPYRYLSLLLYIEDYFLRWQVLFATPGIHSDLSRDLGISQRLLLRPRGLEGWSFHAGLFRRVRTDVHVQIVFTFRSTRRPKGAGQFLKRNSARGMLS